VANVDVEGWGEDDELLPESPLENAGCGVGDWTWDVVEVEPPKSPCPFGVGICAGDCPWDVDELEVGNSPPEDTNAPEPPLGLFEELLVGPKKGPWAGLRFANMELAGKGWAAVVMMPPCPFDSGVERTADGVETMLVFCRAEALLATDGEGARDNGRAVMPRGLYRRHCARPLRRMSTSFFKLALRDWVSSDSAANSDNISTSMPPTFMGVRISGMSQTRQLSIARLTMLSVNVRRDIS